ncbi:hypothetical protein [Polyangium fumosum]|uniref:Transglutaminase domain-containing protein n=1 Tax=Polyangium fumosum TaxID=889272 RepID=A0A4U1J4L5_9BACT|nr:hypothetical protein [Polyangium fumosum]TKD01394.1 hypothetical protein E8A74_31625 [Polyangium fumosum]
MSGRTLLALTATSCVFVAGCCCCAFDINDLLTPSGEEEPSATTPGVDLGVAVYPEATPASGATKYAWRDRRLEPPVYRAGYALAADEQRDVDAAHHELAQRLKYQDAGDGAFKWVPPPGCDASMQCIFESLAERSKPDVDPLAARFKARIQEAKLGTLDAVELMTSFVQAIPYEIPKDRPFGLLPPALVVSGKKGDCDSKALLLHMLLDSIGVDSVLLNSNAHRHAMLGVAVPAQGEKIRYQGREYAFVETTAKSAPVGWISKEMLKPNDWVVVPVRIRSPEKAPKNDATTGKAADGPKPKSTKKR